MNVDRATVRLSLTGVMGGRESPGFQDRIDDQQPQGFTGRAATENSARRHGAFRHAVN